jgi:hypothetical protein
MSKPTTGAAGRQAAGGEVLILEDHRLQRATEHDIKHEADGKLALWHSYKSRIILPSSPVLIQ